jgi:hypothetical protein
MGDVFLIIALLSLRFPVALPFLVQLLSSAFLEHLQFLLISLMRHKNACAGCITGF